MKKCLNCGEFNDSSTGFCSNCGASDFEEVASAVCPNCKAEVRAGAEFCTECGSRMPVAVVEEIRRGFGTSDAETFGCPHCGNEIPVASVYCPYCGQEVNNFNTNRKVKKYICPNCGQPNDINSRFCSYCFFDLADASVREMTIVVKPKESDGVKLLQCVLVSDEDKQGQVICPNCQALNPFESEYCVKCGQSLKVDVPKKYCFVCGAENAANAKFCVNCKYQFDAPTSNRYNWTCACGYDNDSDADFCAYCGKPRDGVAVNRLADGKSGG